MFKCKKCKEEFSYDEVVGLNINGDVVDISEYALELNGQNPDYLSEIYCFGCYETDWI